MRWIAGGPVFDAPVGTAIVPLLRYSENPRPPRWPGDDAVPRRILTAAQALAQSLAKCVLRDPLDWRPAAKLPEDEGAF